MLASIPWRPMPTLPSTATAPSAQTALVVGPSGSESDTSAGDVYTDKLGHLIHTADNHRGSWRGQGFGLRTDAYGAGLHLTTYAIAHSASTRDPAGDNPGELSLLKQTKGLKKRMSVDAQKVLDVELCKGFSRNTKYQKMVGADGLEPPTYAV